MHRESRPRGPQNHRLQVLTSRRRVLEKRLRYRITHPISDATSWRDKLSISRNLHLLGWMSAMVSVDEAKQVFGRAFSRPPRLLFINPVCFLFSLYYSYIYGACRLRFDGTTQNREILC